MGKQINYMILIGAITNLAYTNASVINLGAGIP